MSRQSQRAGLLIPAAMLAIVLALPAVAPAATKPTVATGSTSRVAPTTVRLWGTVNPNGAKTTYLFQYGTTNLYGNSTPITVAGNGTKTIKVHVDLGALAPATTYHYRLVARNAGGVSNGADRNFTTKRQPLALTLAASPNPVRYGRGTMIGGLLTGTGNAGRPIQLQANPFPHLAGFVNVGNPQVASAQGGFVFTLLSVGINTQFRVVLPSRPQVVSPVVGLGVAPRVGTRVSARTVFTGARVRFSGTVRPARRGARVVIERKRGKRWRYVAATKSRGGGKRFSRYSRRIRIRRGGSYRVRVQSSDGRYVDSTGRTIKIRRR